MNLVFQVRYFCFVSIHRKNKRYKFSKEYGQISATRRVLLIRNLWSRYNEHRRSPLEASFTKSVYAKRSKILSTDHQDSRVLVTCFSLGMFVKVPFTRHFFSLMVQPRWEPRQILTLSFYTCRPLCSSSRTNSLIRQRCWFLNKHARTYVNFDDAIRVYVSVLTSIKRKRDSFQVFLEHRQLLRTSFQEFLS